MSEDMRDSDEFSFTVPFAAMTQAVVNPDNVVKAGYALIRGALSIFTLPIELVVRRDFGSQYVNPIVYLAGWIFLSFVSTFSFLVHFGALATKHDIHGIFGMGTITTLFYAASAFHLYRIWQLIEHPDRELDSELDGSAWPPLEQLPHASRWRRMRVVYEPAIVITITIGMGISRVLDPIATGYLLFCSFALAAKCFLTWFDSWRYQRSILDGKYRSGLIAQMAVGNARPQRIGSHVMPDSDAMPHKDYVVFAEKVTGLKAQGATS